MIDARTAGDFFARLWPRFNKDRVEVHLVPAAKSTPLKGAVAWDPDDSRWHVLADSGLGAREVFRVLFHELGHVVHGHTTKDARGWQTMKAAMLGERIAVKEAIHVGTVAKSTKAMRDREDAADAWANEQAAKWWPVLEMIDGAVGKAVRQALQGRR